LKGGDIIKAIPKNFLIHSAKVRTPLKHNSFGEDEFSDDAVLRFVRLDYSLTDPLNGDDKTCGVLIYDCKNSSPPGFEFSVGQEISFGDCIFTACSVTPLFHGRGLHHIEVGLRRGAQPRLSLWRKAEN